MEVLVLVVDVVGAGVDDGPDGLVGDVEEFHEALPAPEHLLLLLVDHHRVASAHVVAVERLFGIDLVFLGSPSGQAEVNDAESLVYRVRFLDALNGLVVFADHLEDICGVGEYVLELSHCSELFLAFVAFDGVPSLVLFDLLVGVGLHGGYNIYKRIRGWAV